MITVTAFVWNVVSNIVCTRYLLRCFRVVRNLRSVFFATIMRIKQKLGHSPPRRLCLDKLLSTTRKPTLIWRQINVENFEQIFLKELQSRNNSHWNKLKKTETLRIWGKSEIMIDFDVLLTKVGGFNKYQFRSEFTKTK